MYVISSVERATTTKGRDFYATKQIEIEKGGEKQAAGAVATS